MHHAATSGSSPTPSFAGTEIENLHKIEGDVLFDYAARAEDVFDRRSSTSFVDVEQFAYTTRLVHARPSAGLDRNSVSWLEKASAPSASAVEKKYV